VVPDLPLGPATSQFDLKRKSRSPTSGHSRRAVILNDDVLVFNVTELAHPIRSPSRLRA